MTRIVKVAHVPSAPRRRKVLPISIMGLSSWGLKWYS